MDADHCNNQQSEYNKDVYEVQSGAQKGVETEGIKINQTMKPSKKQLVVRALLSFSPKFPL